MTADGGAYKAGAPGTRNAIAHGAAVRQLAHSIRLIDKIELPSLPLSNPEFALILKTGAKNT